MWVQINIRIINPTNKIQGPRWLTSYKSINYNLIPIIPIDHLVSIKRLIICIESGSGLLSPILQTKNKIKEFFN